MELDDLRKGWKESTTMHEKVNSKNMEQLEVILKQKTIHVMHTVKSKYKKLISYSFVGILGAVMFFGLAPFILGNGTVYAGPSAVERVLNLLVLCLLSLTFFFFYWLKYIALDTDFQISDVRQALRITIKKLSRSLRQEIVFVVLLFLAWMAIARLHSHAMGHGDFLDIMHADILLAIGLAAVLLGFYLATRVRQYKNYIAELRGYLEELENV